MNRNVQKHSKLTVEFAGSDLIVENAELLHSTLKAANTFEDKNQVKSEAFDGWQTDGGAKTELPPHAFLATTFRLS